VILSLIPFIFIFILVILFLIKKDILSPEFTLTAPIFIALFFYSLMLSEYYYEDIQSFLFLLFCYIFFLGGFFVIGLNRQKNKRYVFLFMRKINSKRLLVVIKAIMILAVVTMIIESIVVTPPLLSMTPNKNYMNFGLPLIHHFISLLTLNIPLTFIYFKATGVKKFIWYNACISCVIFILLTQRLSLLLVLLVLLFSYVFFNKKFFSIKSFLLLSVFFMCFLWFFIIMGEARLGNVGEGFIANLTKTDQNILPPSLALPYIYVSSGVQNTINLLVNLPQYYFGSYMAVNIAPLITPKLFFSFDPVVYQVVINFNTFIFPKSFILDFGLLAPIACFIFAALIKLIYKNSLNGSVWSVIFFLSYALPQGMFLFFSDNFFNSSLLIYLIASLAISSFIRINNENSL